MEQEEADVAAGQEERDVGCLEAVDYFLVPVFPDHAGCLARVWGVWFQGVVWKPRWLRGWVMRWAGRREEKRRDDTRAGGMRAIGTEGLGRIQKKKNKERSRERGGIHSPIRPLHLLDDIQAAVHDERVHVPGLVAEARDAVAALLRGAEFVLEQRVVFGADDAEVVGHFV